MDGSLPHVSHRLRHFQFALVAFLWACLCMPALAQDRESRGTYSLSYQYIREGKVNITTGKVDIGTSDTHSVLFEVEFYLNDKWELFGSLPFITKRYNGTSPHNPATLLPNVNESFIDDGDYHSDFQDLKIGVRYSMLTSRFQIKPFVSIGTPTNDYPIYAHGSVGQGFDNLSIGAVISYMPPLSDAYYSVTATRVFSEKTQGVNIDRWLLDGEIGYFLNPRFVVKGFFIGRTGNGQKFPDDFPLPRNDIHWYEHERLLAVEYVLLGAGMEWALNERNRLSISAMTSIHAEMVHEVDVGVSIGVSRAF